ncbi:MAG: ABC transporter ATP-binding protein, partial [Polyangiaceae bacterium]|nr:ABC transporter ATP-binding protein [Polyangiaceae bacterium]
MRPAIRIENVHKRFGDVEAIAGITADIEAGRLTGVVGPDGAGKTTLVRMMAALMKPSVGRIEVVGRDVASEAAAIHQLTGYMPQRFGLYEDLSVMENLELYARLRGRSDEARAASFDRLLHFTRLEPFKSRLAGRLSGGMKQKLGLACALMARPPVLLLDEPSVGVDPVSRQDLFQMVEELTQEGMAVVWSTGYLDEAERCDSVLLLDHGQLAYAGPPGELTAHVAGRSVLVTGTRGERRRVLSEALALEGVRDGVIQGDA